MSQQVAVLHNGTSKFANPWSLNNSFLAKALTIVIQTIALPPDERNASLSL